MTDIANIKERLADPNERFSPTELYQIFEAIGPEFGWHRSPDLPKLPPTVQTTSLTIPHFEDAGVLVVRPRTNGDILIGIPNLVDEILGGNLEPSPNTMFNANLIALMRTVVVAPVGFVSRVLDDSDGDYLDRMVPGEDGKPERKNIFFEFYQEYNAWMQSRIAEVKAKKSGQAIATGAGIASSSS